MHIDSLKRTVVAALVLVAGPPSLGAQGPPGPDSTPRDTLRAYPLRPVVVTASRVPASQQEVGFATSVLQRRDLTAEPTPYAARALTFLPGISLDEGPVIVHIRGGEDSFAQIMFDGVPINISGGFHDLRGVLLTNVQRIEVARGPLSALWGSAAMSGAVQFITREGQVGTPQFELLAEGGGGTQYGGQAHAELTTSGGSERLRYTSGLGFAYNRGIYAIADNLLTSDASLRVDATPAERWTLTATARYMAIQENVPVRDAGATRVPLDPQQRDRHYRWLGSLSAGWAATPTWRHRVTASVLWDDINYQDARDTLLAATAYPFFVSNYNLTFRGTLLRPRLEYVGSNELPLGRAGSLLSLSYGGDWQREAESTSQAGDFGPAQSDFGRSNAAVFTELQSRLGSRLSLLTGARLEKFQGLPAELLPRASVVVAVVPERLALRAAAGRAFKAPNVDQQFLDNPATIPNPGLKPESSEGWEVGATVTGSQRAFTVGIGYFHQRYNDLIQTVPADTGSKQTNKNLGRTRAVGVEFELERWWTERWRTGGNLTWVKTEVLDNAGLDPIAYPVGGSLPLSPSVTANAYVAVDVSRSLATLARITLVGRQTVFTERFAGQRVTLDPYALLQLVAQWQVKKTLGLYARIDNLLNAAYQIAFDHPGVPRTGVLGVRTGL